MQSKGLRKVENEHSGHIQIIAIRRENAKPETVVVVVVGNHLNNRTRLSKKHCNLMVVFPFGSLK